MAPECTVSKAGQTLEKARPPVQTGKAGSEVETNPAAPILLVPWHSRKMWGLRAGEGVRAPKETDAHCLQGLPGQGLQVWGLRQTQQHWELSKTICGQLLPRGEIRQLPSEVQGPTQKARVPSQ